MSEPFLSSSSMSLAGVLVLSIIAIEYGGTFVLKVTRRREPATELQTAFFRAGHGHAGVLVILALVVQLYVDGAGLDGMAAAGARTLVPASAILMPAGFFFSAAGAGRTSPNRWIVLVWAGAATLLVGLASLGIGLVTA